MKFSELTKIATEGITPAGKMAVALTLTRTENSRVKSGTAMPSPIYGGTVPPAEVRRRRARNKRARRSRAINRRGNV